MQLKSLYLTAFAVVSVIVKTGAGDEVSQTPIDQEMKGEKSPCASDDEDVKQLQENQLLRRTDDSTNDKTWSAIDTLKADLDAVNQTVENLKDAQDNLTSTKNKTWSAIDTLKADLDAVNQTVANLKDAQDNLTSTKNKTWSVIDTLKAGLEAVNQTVENLKDAQDNLTRLMKSKAGVDHMEEETCQQKSLPALERKVEANTASTNENKQKIEKYKDLIELNRQEVIKLREQTDLLDSYVIIIKLLLVLCLAVEGVRVWQYFFSGANTDTRKTSQISTPRRREPNDYNLTWQGPKEKSVCVVTFCSATVERHLRETRSVFESVGANLPTIHTRMIERHANIRDLPGCRVFLVYVDFNERNVILENPTTGGDLRLTTVKSLMRFGSDVSVIYSDDRGSRNLDMGLFNPDLTSINSQTELTELKKQQRMFSIYDRFTDFQKRHCVQFMTRALAE